MVTANILQRVLRVKCGLDCGTAFTVESAGKQFLISAKHVFEGLSQGLPIEVYKDSSWQIIEGNSILCKDESKDIIAFELRHELTDSHDLPITLASNGAFLSQDIFFLGYPYGKSHNVNSSDGFPIPIVKKGIISMIGDPMVFDGHNNPGFSGGPVLVNDTQGGIQVVAIVSGFYTDSQNSPENSGIFFGDKIDYIVTAIKEYIGH